ncbi:MAG: tandem-95 repeat protein [Planctomycetes bacterium]|nr:tandem-95 repeat protein [Planctomycetota bacterium]
MLLSDFYDLTVIAQTGQQTATAGQTITAINAFTSLNDSGQVAFVANVTDGSALLAGDGSAAPRIIGFPPNSTRTYSFPQINNAGIVVVREQLTGSPPNSFIGTWPTGAGSREIIVNNDPNNPWAEGPYDSVILPTIANDGGVGFVGLTGGATVASLYFNPTATPGQEAFVTDLTGGGGFRPMAADGGKVLVRTGSGTMGDLKINDDVIASTSGSLLPSTVYGWDALGPAAGISDDGRIVVFYGDLSAPLAARINAANGDVAPVPLAPGPGIFGSVEIGTRRHIIRIAGESGNGFIDPGERRPLGTMNDVGPDFDYDGAADWQIGAAGFSTTSRVGITKPKDFALGDMGSFVTVIYHANDVIGTTGPAIYTSRINLFKDGSGNFNSIGVEAPVQVARAGDNVAGFGAIQDVLLYDPINNDGDIVFWASAAGVQGVLKALRDTTVNDRVQGRNRPRFDPDSPLVEYVVAGLHALQNMRDPINQIVLHAVADDERGGLLTLTAGTLPGIHYLIGREGRVTQIIREEDVANQAPPANSNSIGIELVDDFSGTNGQGTGHIENADWATNIQRKKAALLVRDIALRYGVHDAARMIFHLIGTNDPAYVEQAFEDAVPLSTGTPMDEDGIDNTQSGVLAHGQVFDRTGGRTDPQNFNWLTFMTEVNNGIGFTLNSPGNLLVTDPMGRRVGVDAATGQTLLEIPGARFTGAGTEPQVIAIPGGIDGAYQVQVVGTGDGMFHLDLFAASRGGELMRTQVADQLSSGATIGYTLNYTTAIGAQPTVTAASNLPPVAFDDQYFSRGDGAVQMPVLSNDSDPEGLLDVSSLTVVQPPLSGTTAADPATGILTYTPNPGFVGDDSFQYEVRDTAGAASGVATVIVHVLRQTQSPVAGDDDRTTPFDTPIVIDVLANDSDPDGTLDPTTVEIDHDGDPQNGSVSIDPVTGQITYTPNPEFFGTDTFKYAVLDNDLANSLATVTVTVLPPDGPEVAVTGNGQVIVDGDTTPDIGDHTEFGLVPQNQLGPLRVFTVRNIGPATLTLGPVSVPTGFTLVEPLGASLDPGASDTFTVRLNTATLGTFGGEVSFSTNDPNENPFRFTIAGAVGIPPGSLDLTFGGGDGRVITNGGASEIAYSVALQPDGKILVGGSDGRFAGGFFLARYKPDGSLDTSFGGGDGLVTTGFGANTFADGRKVLLLPDGKIVLVGGVSSASGIGVGLARYHPDGTLDNTFSGDGRATGFLGVSFVEDAELQPDGKIVAIGSFTGHGRDFAVVRFNADGTPDTTFDGDGIATTDLTPDSSFSNDPPQAMLVQPDGKIVVAGVADSDVGLVRYNTDGSLDTTFGGGDGIVITDLAPIGFGAVANTKDVALQPDGKIVVVGNAVARYNADGTLDTTFSGDGLVPIEFGFGSDAGESVLIQPDGKVLVAGPAGSNLLLFRLRPDGSLDTAFDGDGIAITGFLGPGLSVGDSVLQPDGKIVVAGSSGSSTGADFGVARFQNDVMALPLVTLSATDAEGSEQGPDGLRFTVTRSGAADQPLTVFFEVQNNGAAGQATLGADFQLDAGLTQVTIPAGASSADIDMSVLPDVLIEGDELVTLAIIQSPEYLYFIGLPFIADGVIQGECEQVALDGTLDPTFGGGDGLVATDFEVGFTFSNSLALQPDGKVLVAARVAGPEKVAIARYRMNGIPDPSFDNDGLVITPLQVFFGMRPTVAVQPDGKVIAAGVVGNPLDFAMARYLPNGAVDTTFGGGDGLVITNLVSSSFPHDFLNTVLVQPDGKILLAGYSSSDSTGHDWAIARYNSDGSLDPTFGGGNGFVFTDLGGPNSNDQIHSIVLQPDGKIVAAGYGGAAETDFAVARYNADGSLDTTFGAGAGFVITSIGARDEAYGLALQSDGKILIGGFANLANAEAVVVRYNSDGSLDGSFGGGDGIVIVGFSGTDAVGSIAVQADGKIVITGSDDGRVGVARFHPDGSPDLSFGGGDGMVTVSNYGAAFGQGSGAPTTGVLQPDGKLVVTSTGSTGGASNAGFNLARFTGPCILQPSPPTISGTVFEDTNGDGARDNGEPGLMGWEIRAYADLNTNGLLDAADIADGIKASDTTEVNGGYVLNLVPGDYIIVEVLQTDWVQSFPTASVNPIDATLGEFGYALSLVSGQTATGNDFGNFRLAAVTGQKFEDLDGDGLKDDSEPGIVNWQIRAYADLDSNGALDLDDLAEGTKASNTTDASGDFVLRLAPGDYILVEALQNEWIQSFPGTSVNTIDATLGEFGYALSLVSGQTSTGLDFGNFQPDTQPPAIDILAPTPDSIIETNVLVVGTVADDLSGVASLVAQIDDGPFFDVMFDAAGSFSFPTDFALDGSEDGRHRVRLRATDEAGNVSGFVDVFFTLQTPETCDRVFVVPGLRGQEVRLTWTFGSTAFENEVGVFEVDDDAGSVDGLLPTDPSYSEEAIRSGRVVFHSGQGAGAARELIFSGGDRLVFYIIQNNTTKEFLWRNPDNSLAKLPLAFFSLEEANPDAFDHARGRSLPEAGCELSWEDLTFGGDQDFNDVVFTVEVSDYQPTAVFRGGMWFFDLDGRGGRTERAFAFGLPGDVPVAGDWDGDGETEVGVFRGGAWFLDLDDKGGAAEKVVFFGVPGDVPAVGDYNGDGVADLAVFRSGMWFFDLYSRGGRAEQAYAFGLPGDVPVVGDWDGDRADEAAVFRGGMWFFNLLGRGGEAERHFAFGLPGDVPVAGDWDGNGKSDAGIFRGGIWFLDARGRGGAAEGSLSFGIGGDTPLTGRWPLVLNDSSATASATASFAASSATSCINSSEHTFESSQTTLSVDTAARSSGRPAPINGPNAISAGSDEVDAAILSLLDEWGPERFLDLPVW